MPTSLLFSASTLPRATEGASFDDASASVRVLVTVGVLAAIGVVLLSITWWWWRSTRPEPDALAPLATIGTRRFRHGNDEQRRKALASARPVGSPLAGERDDNAREPSPPTDLAALAAGGVPSFDDLFEDPFTPGPSAAPPTDGGD